MPLTNAQYDEIMRGYSKRQWQAEQTARARKEQLYKKVPRLHEIDADIASTSVQRAKKLHIGRQTGIDRTGTGYPETDPRKAGHPYQTWFTGQLSYALYTCPDCKDTGYIEGKNVIVCNRQR